MWNLLEKYGIPVYSQAGSGPSGGAGDGGAGDGGAGDGDAEGADDGLPPIYGGENGDEIDADLTEIMGAFKDPNAADETDDTVDLSPELTAIPQAEVTAMETSVKTAIAKMTVGDSMIPDNFDPADRAQLKTLLDKTVQATVSQVMGVVFKPVQLALAHTVKQLGLQMDSKVKAGLVGVGARDILATIVPESTMPEYSGLVKTLDDTLRKKGNKPEARARLIRKTLNQMNINVAASGTGSRRVASGPAPNGQTSTKRSGKAALDSFFGEWTQPKA